jgi:thioredoxin-like negative regulator of GroEL
MRNPELSQGKTTVLFFTGEHCSVCHHRQKPALEVVRSSHNGDLRVIELDAAEESSLARRFGVLSLPSTVILAADGTVGAVNYGFAPSDQINAQVASVA